MEKNHINAFFIAIPVLIAFGLVSFLLVISGRSPRFLKHKLRLGAILISLGIFSNTSCFPPAVVCYSPMPENCYVVYNSTENIFQGSFNGNAYSELYYEITQQNSSDVIESGTMQALDGTADSIGEAFQINPVNTFSTGDYTISIYDTNTADRLLVTKNVFSIE